MLQVVFYLEQNPSAWRDLWRKVITKYTCEPTRVVDIPVNIVEGNSAVDSIYDTTFLNTRESTDLYVKYVARGLMKKAYLWSMVKITSFNMVVQ